MTGSIIGREDELASLDEFVARPGGGLAALLVEGPAGIGKTTLWLAGVEAARSRGVRVLVTRPAEAESGLSYSGLGDLLHGVLDDLLPQLPPPRRRVLEVALLLEEPEGQPPGPLAVRAATFNALAALAREDGVVVAVDDVQWLDGASAEALAFAVRRLEADDVRVLLSSRVVPDDEPSGVELVADERLERLRVGPLSLGAVHRLVRERLGKALSRMALHRVYEVSGGNPFFALELARTLSRRAAGGDPAAILRVSKPLERLVQDRLDALDPTTREALLTVAALGRPDVELLDAAGIGRDVLDVAVAAEAIEIDEGDVRFTHPLLASTVYGAAAPERRRALHRRLARLVGDPVAPARHVALAAGAPRESVASALEQAAGVARGRGAMRDAAELGELAGRSTPRARRADARRRGLRAARDCLAAGDSARAREIALSLPETDGSRAETFLLLGEIEARAGTPPEAIRYLEEGLRAPSASPEVEVGLRQLLALVIRGAEGVAVAEAHAVAAVEAAERTGDPGLVARALAALSVIRFSGGDPDAVDQARRALVLARGAENATALIDATQALGHCLCYSGVVGEAREILLESYTVSVERDESEAAVALWYLALAEWRGGRWEIARGYAEQARELSSIYAGIGQEGRHGLEPLALLAASTGAVAEARELVELGFELSAAEGSRFGRRRLQHGILGLLEHWEGDRAAAVEQFRLAEELGRAAGSREPTTAFYVPDQVEALLELDRVDDAVETLAAWEHEAERLGRTWSLAEATRCRGLVAAARGDVHGAVETLEEAVERHALAGDPFGRARALLALGVARRRLRQKRAAREALEEALAGFEELGARGWAERTRAEIGRIGGRTRLRGPDARRAPGRRPRRRRADEPRGRGRPLSPRAHGREPPLPHLRKARRALPHGAGAQAELTARTSEQSSGVLTFPSRGPSRSVGRVPSYVVETFLARSRAAERVTCERRARSAAVELTRAGTPVRFDGAIHVPEDEICFFVFDASSGHDAALVAERAGLDAVRVVEAVTSREEKR